MPHVRWRRRRTGWPWRFRLARSLTRRRTGTTSCRQSSANRGIGPTPPRYNHQGPLYWLAGCPEFFDFYRPNVINSLLERKIEKRPDQVRLQGRILFLTEDPELIKRQLAGADVPLGTKESADKSKRGDDNSN